MDKAPANPNLNPNLKVGPEIQVYERSAILFYPFEKLEIILNFEEPIVEILGGYLDKLEIDEIELIERYISVLKSITVKTIENRAQIMSIERNINYTTGYMDNQKVRVYYTDYKATVTLHNGGNTRKFEIADSDVIELLKYVLYGDITVKEFVEKIAKIIENDTREFINAFLYKVSEISQ